MDDQQFEYALRDLLARDGWAATKVGRGGDQAADVIGVLIPLGRIVAGEAHPYRRQGRLVGDVRGEGHSDEAVGQLLHPPGSVLSLSNPETRPWPAAELSLRLGCRWGESGENRVARGSGRGEPTA
ncbi:restriction endonuclease [Streptomyces erythrochromogenes]|uniref:restriction endonuclease n=1 Tax=Streptomyces erythrochromogenes TaxID=285574 RepID=UPI0033255D92